GNDDLVAGQGEGTRPGNLEGMWIEERGRSFDHLDAVAPKLVAHDGALVLDHVLRPPEQVVNRHGARDAVRVAVDRPLCEAGQIQDRGPSGLRRDRAAVGADAAERLVALDQRDAASELRTLDGGLLPGRARSDDEQVVARHAAFASFPSACSSIWRTRSRVTPSSAATASAVCATPSLSPKRSSITLRPRSDRRSSRSCRSCLGASCVTTSTGSVAFGSASSSMRSLVPLCPGPSTQPPTFNTRP